MKSVKKTAKIMKTFTLYIIWKTAETVETVYEKNIKNTFYTLFTHNEKQIQWKTVFTHKQTRMNRGEQKRILIRLHIHGNTQDRMRKLWKTVKNSLWNIMKNRYWFSWKTAYETQWKTDTMKNSFVFFRKRFHTCIREYVQGKRILSCVGTHS